MLYISYGMPKSASSFVFLLASGIANLAFNQTRILMRMPSYLRSTFQDDFNDKVDAIEAKVPSDRIFVIKTHNHLDENILQKIRANRAMASVTIRDPYDIVVSLIDAGRKERRKAPEDRRPYFAAIESLEDALQLIPDYLSGAETWLQHADDSPNCMTIRFDQLRENPVEVARALAKQMKLEVNADAVVTEYLRDKSKIWEYNVGVSGRGHTEITIPTDHPVRAQMDDFVRKNLNPALVSRPQNT